MRLKWFEVLRDVTLRPVRAVRLWEVRWTRRMGAFSADRAPAVEAFPERETAEQFARSLRVAFKLLQHTGEGTEVTVKEQER